MTNDAPRPTLASSQHGRAPRWLIGAIVVLTLAVVATSVFVGVRWNARRAELLSQDPRITYLQDKVRNNPGDDRARKQLAQVYAQSGRRADSLREYGKILSDAPNDVFALYNTGVMRLAEGDDAAGEKALKRVLEIDPANTYAAMALAEHYASVNRFDAIIPAVKRAADAHPTLADLQYLTALGYEKMSQKENAIKYYRRALNVVPEMQEARDGLARLGGGR